MIQELCAYTLTHTHACNAHSAAVGAAVLPHCKVSPYVCSSSLPWSYHMGGIPSARFCFLLFGVAVPQPRWWAKRAWVTKRPGRSFAAGGSPKCGVPVPIVSHHQSTPINSNKVARQPARHVPPRFQRDRSTAGTLHTPTAQALAVGLGTAAASLLASSAPRPSRRGHRPCRIVVCCCLSRDHGLP